jgi:hypothetical protein
MQDFSLFEYDSERLPRITVREHSRTSRCGSSPAHLLRGLADLLLGQDKPDRSHIGQAKGLTEPNTNK